MLPECNSTRIMRTLETAMNQLYPGAAPYGPTIYKVVKIRNATELYAFAVPQPIVICIALVTTANGEDANQLERNSYGMINASHVTEQTVALFYAYSMMDGRNQLQLDFNGMRKSTPLSP